MASVRREIRIACSADEIWAVVGDSARLAEWFPGVVACTVEGTTRHVTTASGLTMPEEIVTVDAVARRFAYRLTAPIVRDHVAAVDIFDLGDGTCLVSYATDAEPEAMTLMLGGATGAALRNLRQLLEHRTEQ